MDFLTHLWLPILLSAAGVWIASAVAWMAINHHAKDYRKLPNEEAFTNAVRGLNIPPGNYMFPHAGDDRKACRSPEFMEKWKKGPAGIMGIWQCDGGMGGKMILTFLVYIVVSTLIAYLGWVTLPHENVAVVGGVTRTIADASFSHVFRALGTAGVLAYAFAHLPNGIWFGQYPRAMMLCVIDGIVYGLITGAIFAWLWP